jgi:uncharacterized protein YjaG (DUF416 family)
MDYKTFTENLKSHITALSPFQRKELGLAVCKKLFFYYQRFSDENSWGNPDMLLDGINFIQESNLNTTNIQQAKKFIEEITPDTEDFENYSYALNAAAAVWDTVFFLIDHDLKHIFSCCTYLTDTIDFKIQESDELTQSQIDEHQDMIDARNFLLEFN